MVEGVRIEVPDVGHVNGNTDVALGLQEMPPGMPPPPPPPPPLEATVMGTKITPPATLPLKGVAWTVVLAEALPA
ncbi:MAG: hypothetical protein ABJC33_12155 [Betaproteobacteria bacterium]